ncbi:hypothetical protein D3C71_1831710 [compost metagenome]
MRKAARVLAQDSRKTETSTELLKLMMMSFSVRRRSPSVVRRSDMSVSVCTRCENNTCSVACVRSSATYPMAPMTTRRIREKAVPK